MRTLDVNGLDVDYWVAWLPGTTSELLFGTRTGSGDSERAGIYSIQADGSGLTPIVPSVVGPVEYKSVDLAPDGRTLTYWRWESATRPGRIHQLDIATKGDTRVEVRPVGSYGEGGLLHSPDGSQVVLARNGTTSGPRAQIMIAPADASRPGILVGRPFDKDTDEPGSGFSPDGKTVFVTFAGEAPQFFDAATGAPRTGPSTKSAECCSWQRLAP